MRAAVLTEGSDAPAVQDVGVEDPVGKEVAAEILAAALNPVDLLIAAGRHASIRPQRPYIPGFEGVARVADVNGVRRMWWIAGVGAWAERARIDPESAVDVPDSLSDEMAAAIGIAGIGAWLALSYRANVRSGERVLVVGASGAVGRFAIQFARLMGAERVIAAARSSGDQLLALGADAVVDTTTASFLDDLRRVEPSGFDVVLDLLFGKPGEAAIEAAADEGRIVLMSQLAGASVSLSTAALQRRLSIFGFRNSTIPAALRQDAYTAVASLVAAGRLSVALDTFSLGEIGDAWRRQRESPHLKLVVVP